MNTDDKKAQAETNGAGVAPEKAKPKSYKIDGRDFQRVKALSQNYIATMEENRRREIEANSALFKAIAEAIDVDYESAQHLSLNRTHEDLGIYIVEEGDCCPHDVIGALLSSLVKKKRAA